MNYPICWPGTKTVKSTHTAFTWQAEKLPEQPTRSRGRLAKRNTGRLLDSAGRAGVVRLEPRNINAISIDPHPLKSAGKTARLKGKT